LRHGFNSRLAKDYVKTTLNGAYELLKVLKDSSDVFIVLKSVVGGVIACVDVYKVRSLVLSTLILALFYAQKTSGNHEEMERVLKSIDRLASVLTAKLKESKDHKQLDHLVKVLSTYASGPSYNPKRNH